MKNWQGNQLQSLLNNKNEEQRFQTILSLSRELGFDYCAYGLRVAFPLTNPKIVMFNNYPSVWQTEYQNKNYLAVDPTVRHGTSSLLPIVWSDDLFSPARDLWEEARSHGLCFGWAQSMRDSNGVVGMLTLARSDEPITQDELQDKSFKMAWLTQIVHTTMAQSLVPKIMPEINAKLSNREREVLCWTADGKTSSEISCILNISERTVNFHVNNVLLKLNSTNKTAAVVKAAMLGML